MDFSNLIFKTSTIFIIFLLILTKCNSSHRFKRQMVFPYEWEDDSCLTPEREIGQCIPIRFCPQLSNIRPGVFRRYYRRYVCGFMDQSPMVCCSAPPLPPTTTTTTTTTTPRPVVRNEVRFSNIVAPPERPSILPTNCGTNNNTSFRIIGGREAERGSWPWMAIIFVQRNGGREFDCGGSLVTNQHIITAAHCLVDQRTGALITANRLIIRLGEHDMNSDNDGASPIDVPVEWVRLHENYERRTFRNDIAIIKLARAVEFNDAISPICLPYDDFQDVDLTERNSFVTGWGTTAFRGPTSNVLREVQFPIWEQMACRQAFERIIEIRDVHLCAGTADGSRDACEGDSGGPLMLPNARGRYYLIGIVSFGQRCATPDFPGVYTRVQLYLDWIAANLT